MRDCLCVNTPVVERGGGDTDFYEPQLVDLSFDLNDDILLPARKASSVALHHSHHIRKHRVLFST